MLRPVRRKLLFAAALVALFAVFFFYAWRGQRPSAAGGGTLFRAYGCYRCHASPAELGAGTPEELRDRLQKRCTPERLGRRLSQRELSLLLRELSER